MDPSDVRHLTWNDHVRPVEIGALEPAFRAGLTATHDLFMFQKGGDGPRDLAQQRLREQQFQILGLEPLEALELVSVGGEIDPPNLFAIRTFSATSTAYPHR